MFGVVESSDTNTLYVWCCGEFGDKHVVCLVLWRVRRQTRCMFGVVESSETNTLYVWCCGEFGDTHVACCWLLFLRYSREIINYANKWETMYFLT
jgi:hypothetical protein